MNVETAPGGRRPLEQANRPYGWLDLWCEVSVNMVTILSDLNSNSHKNNVDERH